MIHIRKWLVICILGLSTSMGIAQSDSDVVLETVWYLQSMVIDGQEILAPINDEVEFIPFFFDVGDPDLEPAFLFTSVCNEIISSSDVFSDVIIIVAENPSPLIDCQLQENIDFDALYFDFLGATTEFPYELIDESGSLQLILTAPNGDMAIYGDELLAIEEVNINSFKAYPNPVQDILLLEIPQEVKQYQIAVYNASGKEIVRTSQQLSSLDMGAYSQGLYFIVVVTDQGDIVKKIMKQ